MSFGTPNSFASRSFGVTSIQSVMLKVPCSEKAPLSKDRMKWQGSSPLVWPKRPSPFCKDTPPPELPGGARHVVVDLAGAGRLQHHGLAAAGDDEGPFGGDGVPMQF